jgi:hypothetical protein
MCAVGLNNCTLVAPRDSATVAYTCSDSRWIARFSSGTGSFGHAQPLLHLGNHSDGLGRSCQIFPVAHTVFARTRDCVDSSAPADSCWSLWSARQAMR